ncbi:MAG: 50S ribosomal protein L4 [Flavobacteriales bacterium]|nr:MAG: 50S ribosomal protein L4 [Flavobacteriales bacterium]
MQIEVLNSKGEKTGRSVELPEDIFNIEPNDHVIYLAVKQYLAARRLGTHKTKTRAEVKGSSRKLHRQKGTGGSRKGNIRNPLYKGGGAINGPQPHAYDFKLNRKVKDLAKMSALTYKAKDNQIVIVEDIKVDTPNTKTMLAVLNSLNLADHKTLLVNADYDANFYLSVRNLPKVKTSVLSDINTYDILNAKTLVITESAAKIFNEAVEEVEA